MTADEYVCKCCYKAIFSHSTGRIIIKLLTILLIMHFSNLALADDKIYTNEDLQPYEMQHQREKKPAMENSIVQTSDFNRSFNELRKYIEQELANVRIPRDC